MKTIKIASELVHVWKYEMRDTCVRVQLQKILNQSLLQENDRCWSIKEIDCLIKCLVGKKTVLRDRGTGKKNFLFASYSLEA